MLDGWISREASSLQTFQTWAEEAAISVPSQTENLTLAVIVSWRREGEFELLCCSFCFHCRRHRVSFSLLFNTPSRETLWNETLICGDKNWYDVNNAHWYNIEEIIQWRFLTLCIFYLWVLQSCVTQWQWNPHEWLWEKQLELDDVKIHQLSNSHSEQTGGSISPEPISSHTSCKRQRE